MTTIYVTRDTPLPARRAHELYPTAPSLRFGTQAAGADPGSAGMELEKDC